MAEQGKAALWRQAMVEAVQRNCDIADAQHATDMSLCTYLLQMREFHRWERGLPFGAVLDREAIGDWIAERELRWAALETQPFLPLPLPRPLSCQPASAHVDPFDVATVNDGLAPLGLLYGAGLVGVGGPVFFLAERHGQAVREGLQVLTAGRELARGLLAPPAALAGEGHGPIVLRRESLARWCWERFEAFTLRRTPGSPWHAVAQAYGLDRDFDAALPRWLDEQGEALVLHELGEHRVGHLLGPGWAAMRLALPGRRADLYARAVRDHLADLLVTLPTLLDRGPSASLHFWFASFDGVRELLFPSLKDAYTAWRQGDGGRALRRAIERGQAHFSALARGALELHARDGAQAAGAIESLLTAPEAVCAASTV